MTPRNISPEDSSDPPRRFSDQELADMKRRIDETWECVSNIDRTLALHVQSCVAREAQIDRHEKLLRGDSDDSSTDGGLVGKVRGLEKWKAGVIGFGTMSVSSLAWLVGDWLKRKFGLQ